MWVKGENTAGLMMGNLGQEFHQCDTYRANPLKFLTKGWNKYFGILYYTFVELCKQ